MPPSESGRRTVISSHWPLVADRQQHKANSTAAGRTARMYEEMVRAKERRTRSRDILHLQNEVTQVNWRLPDLWADSLGSAALGIAAVNIALRQAEVNIERSRSRGGPRYGLGLTVSVIGLDQAMSCHMSNLRP